EVQQEQADEGVQALQGPALEVDRHARAPCSPGLADCPRGRARRRRRLHHGMRGPATRGRLDPLGSKRFDSGIWSARPSSARRTAVGPATLLPKDTMRPSPAARRSAIAPADLRRLERARALVAEMAQAEKISLLHQYSPGIERLGIGPFVTGTEGVHGLAWRGKATQFPQPVGLAATWDPTLLTAAAGVVAEEVRELHATGPGVSLTVWAPVVNLLRHPLWGRTEEAYTEDPLLNAELGSAYSRGL